ncbi:cadherin-like domain-containing protein [Aromatoleum toluclasticum]|uniref:cadherin-like domain-containing protein n=1 Tax=Aromatoleum toluclasticum TaxID=92003 RepID=UPI000360E8D8|nr:cadherin-like domain-containing protein [Aromatoleum toluclasticum]
MNNFKRNAIAAGILALTLASGPSQAVLERVGPPDNAPAIGGYPAWYQDTTGLALEFCNPMNLAEVEGGWCLLLPGDVPAIPEVFPTSYFDEHFWFAADAGVTPASGGRALLTLALEGAFVADVVPGGQITFARVRLVLNPVPVTGTYRFIHPYGEKTVQAQAGDKIFFTDDVGINCPPGQYDCAMQGSVGPFLLPANAPGGAELPPVAGPVPGKLYIADPARVGPVTGSALPPFTDSTGQLRNHNIFRIEGPAGSGLGVDPVSGARVDFLQTADFSLMGRVFTGTLPGRVAVERATYERDATAIKLDVFATASGTSAGRLPAQPRPVPIAPQLSFFDAPCAGTIDPVSGAVLPPYAAPAAATETQLVATSPDMYWAQTAPTALPSSVCVKDLTARDVTGNVVPVYHSRVVSDQVNISVADFDRATGTLSVSAESSDRLVLPVLTLAYGTVRQDLIAGQTSVPNLLAPPSAVRVLSSAFGADDQLVRTAFASGAPVGVPVAVNDTFSLSEDSPLTSFNVLANDTGATGGTVALSSQPLFGTAAVNPDGTIGYTPTPDAFGTDLVTYTVTLAGQVSNTGTATITITPVNDPPTAVNDAMAGVANTPLAIAVTANDTDPDGAADIVAATNVTQPTGATVTVNGGVVTFTAPTGGTYSFTYYALDAAGVTSANPATVTVQVAAAEALSITRSEYIVSKGRMRAQGTISPVAGQTIAVEFLNVSGAVIGFVGTGTTDAVGNWSIDVATPLPANATHIRATSSNGTSRTATIARK